MNMGDLFGHLPPTSQKSQPIKAANIKVKWSKAISLALSNCPMSREEIAKQMGDYLGENISPNILDAYASQGRDTHIINLPRLEALIFVTGDISLVNLLADVLNHVAIHKTYIDHVDYAVWRVARKELNDKIKNYEEQWND